MPAVSKTTYALGGRIPFCLRVVITVAVSDVLTAVQTTRRCGGGERARRAGWTVVVRVSLSRLTLGVTTGEQDNPAGVAVPMNTFRQHHVPKTQRLLLHWQL